MPLRLDAAAAGFADTFAAFVEGRRTVENDVTAAVGRIIADVRARGDDALLALTAAHDRLHVGSVAALRVPVAELAAARAACAPEVIAALERAAARIAAFHDRLLPGPLSWRDADGVRLGARWTPLESAGIYVPGGTAAYPSSVLMNAIPARIAGVERIAMATPAPGGRLDPLVLAAAAIAGIEEVWRIGGAQAITALAYGTATIAAVDKITGPGNAYVAEAKRQVFGKVGIDLIAGPSEILVVADADNDPEMDRCGSAVPGRARRARPSGADHRCAGLCR